MNQEMKLIIYLTSILLLCACIGNNSQGKISEALSNDSGNHTRSRIQIAEYDSTFLQTGWYYVVDYDNGFKRKLDQSTDTFFIQRYPIVTAKNFTTLEIYESDADGIKYVGMTMRLDEKGTQSWSVATEKSIGKQLAFILDNQLLFVAQVNAQITAGIAALNRGIYSKAELESFKTTIENER